MTAIPATATPENGPMIRQWFFREAIIPGPVIIHENLYSRKAIIHGNLYSRKALYSSTSSTGQWSEPKISLWISADTILGARDEDTRK